MDWLNQNSQAVLVLVGLVGLVVAGLYAYFTWGLWVETTHQVNVTQQMFEAGHRPWLSVESDWAAPPSPTSMSIDSILQNHGTVPAMVTRWWVKVHQGQRHIAEHDTKGAEISLCVFPGRHEKTKPVLISSDDAQRVLASPEHLRVDATVKYQGLGGRQYSTRVVAHLIGGHIVTERHEVT